MFTSICSILQALLESYSVGKLNWYMELHAWSVSEDRVVPGKRPPPNFATFVVFGGPSCNHPTMLYFLAVALLGSEAKVPVAEW